MTAFPRLSALGLLFVAVPPAQAELAPPVRAMLDAAMATGTPADVEMVGELAKRTNPDDQIEIDLLLGFYERRLPPLIEVPLISPPDPVRVMLDAAIASGKDSDVEAVGKLAKAASPEDVAEIDILLADYRTERKRLKDEAVVAERTRLAEAKFWQNWKGEGQIGASHSGGNSQSTGLNLGVALARKGIDWSQRMRAQADYQRSSGKTTLERYLVEYEPQVKVSDRAFAFGLGRWERDRLLGYTARWNASGGLGYKLIDSKAMSLNLKAGPAWRQTDYIRTGRDSELSGLAGFDFGWQLSPTLRLTQVASTIIGESNSATSSLTALNAKLTGGLSARIAYSAEIASHPPVGVENVDTLTRFTLVYGF